MSEKSPFYVVKPRKCETVMSCLITLCYPLLRACGMPPRRCGRCTAKAGYRAPGKLRGNELLAQPGDGNRFWHIPAAPTEHFCATGRRPSRVTGRRSRVVFRIIPVRHPLPDVTGHVEDTIWTSSAWIGADGCRSRRAHARTHLTLPSGPGRKGIKGLTRNRIGGVQPRRVPFCT